MYLKFTCFVIAIFICGYCEARTPTILISIDGFANSYLDRFEPVHLNKLRKEGSYAEALLPVFPSKTFPNHLSMVTGVYPQSHGIVHNKFYHKGLNAHYRLGAGKKDKRWLTAKPIWEVAENNDVKTAIFLWPESEAILSGTKPSFNVPYNKSIENRDRILQVINWLKLPPNQRPALVLTYFSTIDSIGHRFGSDTVELKQAVKAVDDLIGELMHEIDTQLDGDVNLVIVSDHGMVERENIEANIIDLSISNVNDPALTVVNGNTQLYIYTENEQQAFSLYDQMRATQRRMSDERYVVSINGSYPAHWQVNKKGGPIPDIIVNANPPFIFKNDHGYYAKGEHGYDARDITDLHAIFLASGPAFQSGAIAAFENVHIHALLSHLVGLTPENGVDSSLKPFLSILNPSK